MREVKEVERMTRESLVTDKYSRGRGTEILLSVVNLVCATVVFSVIGHTAPDEHY